MRGAQLQSQHSRQAWRSSVLDNNTTMPRMENWTAILDQALPKLDRLKSAEKEKLVRALITVVLHDGNLAPAELELLRVTCDLIHVPLPMLATARNM